MATNQVLHGSNRVVEHPNRYKLNAVAGQSNVYDLEKQAGVITDNGTPYNKNILDKIDNVLSYLAPTYEKVIVSESEETYGQLASISVNETFSENSILNKISGTVSQFGSYNPTYEYKANTSNGFKSTKTLTQDCVSFLTYISSVKYTQSEFYTVETKTDTSTNTYHRFDLKTKNDSFWKIYDFKTKCKPTFVYYWAYQNMSVYEIQASNDGNSWITLTSIPNNATTYASNGFYRYYRFMFVSNVNSDGITNSRASEFYCYISSLTAKVSIYENKFIFDNNSTFSNNQRLLIETPSTTDITSVGANTLNDIEISTLLQPNTRYELIYKEDSNKFELGGNLTLFDITLTEAVNQVDLVGISDKIKIGKLYEILIVGTTTSNNRIKFGNSYCGYSSTSSKTIISLFSPILNKISTLWEDSDTAYYGTTATIQGYEYIKCETSSAKFNAGTRIIIKEVA